MGTITITATRRPAALSKVPMAVSVIGEERLQAQALNNIRDIAAEVPSLQFRTTASAKDQSIFIRGMGTISTSPGIESTTSAVVDGVPLARQGQVNLDLLEVDRIEVLRGPQGTLFGKNASAGVVQVISKGPSSYFTGFGEVGYYGGGGETRFKAGVSGPLVEGQLNGLLGVLSADYKGNVTNAITHETVNGYRQNGAVAKLAYVGSADLKALVSLDYMSARNTTPQGVVIGTTFTEFGTGRVTRNPVFEAALLPVVPSRTQRQINSVQNTYAEDLSWGLSAQLDWTAWGGHKWTAISAYRVWQNTQQQDRTRTSTLTAAYPVQIDLGELKFNQVSQELRVASPLGGSTDYVAGLFFFRGDNDETYRRDTTQLLASNATKLDTGVANYGVTTRNMAAFGELTQHFTPSLRGLLGARVLRDDVSFRFARTSTSATPVAGIQTAFDARGNVSHDDYSARTGLQFDLSPSANVYATLSRGYKGPAYNVAFSMLPQDVEAVRPETSMAYEVGYKLSFDRNRGLFTLALFKQDFDDLQVNFRDTYNGSIITRLVNAGSVTTQGVESELTFRPLAALRLTAATAYTKATIKNFVCPTGTTAACNINGQPLPYAPEWKAALSGDYRWNLDSGHTWVLGSSFNWQSKTQFDLNQTPETVQPAYGIWNAYASWSDASGWKVSAVAKNLLNKSYATNVSVFTGGLARWVPRDDQRYFGISARKEF